MMDIKWKQVLIIFIFVVFGYTLGFWIGIPNNITFDATPRMIDLANSTIDKMLNISTIDCRSRLSECEKICKGFTGVN